MKTIITIAFAIIPLIVFTQNVNIPDVNFKNYLVNNTAVNTNNDSHIQASEALAFSGTLAFQFYSINDLTGIEAFRNLTVLDCGDNNLTSLNLSQNTALLELYCYDNQIESLDLSGNTLLQALDCRDNQILNLDVSSNSELYYLSCPFNGMMTLNVQNTALTTLRCYSNQLTTLNLNSNLGLETLICDYNNLSELDLSSNPELTIIDCDYNVLTALNVANTNNVNVTIFDARNNPNLDCIQVDDEVYSEENWTNINESTVFSMDCSLLNNEEFGKNNFSYYPNPVKNSLNFNLDENASITILSLKGQIIMYKKSSIENNSIDVSNLSKGVYLIEILTTKKRYYSRFIKGN
jgi:hypothetical protein